MEISRRQQQQEMLISAGVWCVVLIFVGLAGLQGMTLVSRKLIMCRCFRAPLGLVLKRILFEILNTSFFLFILFACVRRPTSGSDLFT